MQIGKIPLSASNFKLNRIGGSIRGSQGMIKIPRTLTFPEFAGHDLNLLRYEGFAHGAGALLKLEELKEFFREPDVTLPTYIDLGDGEFWGVPKRFSYQKLSGYKNHWTFTIEALWNDITGPVNKQNMILELLLNEGIGTTTVDSLTGNYPGTITGADWETNTVLGVGLYFGGGSDIMTTDPYGIDEITVEGWIRPDISATIFYLAEAAPNWVVRISTAGTVSFLRQDTGDNWRQIDSTIGAITDEKLYHLCAVDNETYLTLYINGVQSGTPLDRTSYTWKDVGSNVEYGASDLFAVNSLGRLYEFRAWNRGLSATEVYANSRRYNV